MTIIIDHKKQRCHGGGAVYFIHSMAPCILWSAYTTVTGSSCQKCVSVAVGYQSVSERLLALVVLVSGFTHNK